MCGAIEGGLSLDGVNVAKEAIIQGRCRVDAAGQQVPVGNAYVRLLDRTGEFTAEVPTDGDRPLPVLRRRRRVDAAHPGAQGRAASTSKVTAQVGTVAEVTIAV